jgi:hypothetical protein
MRRSGLSRAQVYQVFEDANADFGLDENLDIDGDSDSRIVRYEFLLSIVLAARAVEKTSSLSWSESVRIFLNDCVLEELRCSRVEAANRFNIVFDPDRFRNEDFYTPAMDRFLSTYMREFQEMFAMYCVCNKVPGSQNKGRAGWRPDSHVSKCYMSIEVFKMLVMSTDLESESYREEDDDDLLTKLNVALMQSRLFSVETPYPDRCQSIRFMDFLEALARLSKMCNDEDDERPLAMKFAEMWVRFFVPLLPGERHPRRLIKLNRALKLRCFRQPPWPKDVSKNMISTCCGSSSDKSRYGDLRDGSFELHQRYYLHMPPKFYGRRMQHPSLFYQWQNAKLEIEKQRRWESNYEVPSATIWGYNVPEKTEVNIAPQVKNFWDVPQTLRESHFRYFECLENEEQDESDKNGSGSSDNNAAS